MESINEENIEQVMDDIHYTSLTIHDCANSIRFVIKDLEEIEYSANCKTDGCYAGLVNIVEQMANVIKQENEKIIKMSDCIVLLRENAAASE